MNATQITTHVQDGLARLLAQFQNRPVLQGIVAALCEQAQKFEDAAFPVSAGRQLLAGQAQGAQLDGIGELVGLARHGLDDAQYTVLLFGVIAQNNSRADNETLLTIAQNVFIAKSAHVISPYSSAWAKRRAPAALGVEIGSPTIDPSLYPLVSGIVQRSMAAGVNLSWLSTYDATQGFALAGPNAGLGLGDANTDGSGGALAALIYNNLAN